MTVRTRFAPSPTGFLHIGGARTALFNYLFTRHQGGEFILRVEDTDYERSTPEAVQAILQGLEWLGLGYDEGPFYQTQHMERYKTVLQALVEQDQAYRCYCSKERLDQLREKQIAQKVKARYDGHCRSLPEAQEGPYVIRFKNPAEGVVSFEDLILGPISVANTELDDLILARSDGTPTYNFTVVVDDWDMKITHVIRGNDHINNTPRQINLFKALGVTPPRYGHIPMILDESGKKLSKRTGAASVMEYREQGILPQALLNYLVRLGWAHGNQEIFSMEELIRYFDLPAVNKSGAAINPQKLLWLNQQYLQKSSLEELRPEFIWQLQRLEIAIEKSDLDTLSIIALQRERCKTLREMAEKSQFFYTEELPYDSAAIETQINELALKRLSLVADRLKALSDWLPENIHSLLKDLCTEEECKMQELAQPLRIALTGGTLSPPIDKTAYLLGKHKTQLRIIAFLKLFGAEDLDNKGKSA